MRTSIETNFHFSSLNVLPKTNEHGPSMRASELRHPRCYQLLSLIHTTSLHQISATLTLQVVGPALTD